VIVEREQSLVVWGGEYSESRICSVGGISFLCESPDGTHLAFWSDKGESFHLVTRAGKHVWSRKINTDKAAPHDVRFSPTGDAVAFFDDYDGLYRVHFYSIEKNYTTEFAAGWSPIGFDPGLRRFAERKTAGAVGELQDCALGLTPGLLELMRPEHLIQIKDRRGSVREKYRIEPELHWGAFHIDRSTRTCLLVCQKHLIWYNFQHNHSTVIRDCLPNEIVFGASVVGATDRFTAIHYLNGAFYLVNYVTGLCWYARHVKRSEMIGSNVLVVLKHGVVQIVTGTGHVNMCVDAPDGYELIDAKVIDDHLVLALLSGTDRISLTRLRVNLQH
jgi:hypothetical protein